MSAASVSRCHLHAAYSAPFVFREQTLAGIAVITGTTHGIGAVTARELAREGFEVVMLVRDLRAGEAVAGGIREAVRSARVSLVRCDLASLRSVRAAAAEVRRLQRPISMLINNAGMVSSWHRRSEDGFELTFATNHLGPFLLTDLLLEHLEPAARIVNLASRAHLKGRPDFESVADPRARYSATAAYARSKLANVMHTFALARRLEGTGVVANCLHPGVVATNLLPRWLRLVKPLLSPVIFDAERGARTTLHVALSAEFADRTGCYVDEYQQVTSAAAAALDTALQERLWRLSHEWTGGTVTQS